MRSNVRLSLIIPAYQAGRTIARALKSVTSIDLEDLEIIVVDDGSTDNTASIVSDMAESDKRIRLFRQVNQGRSAARDAGFSVAEGRWVMFMDSDDYLLPEAFTELMAYLDSNASLVIFPLVQSNLRDSLNRPLESTVWPQEEKTLSAAKVREATLQFDPRLLPYPGTYQINSACSRLYRRDQLSTLLLKSPWNQRLFPQGLRFSEDRLFNIAFLSIAGGESIVKFAKTPLYYWDLAASGTTGLFRQSDIVCLRDFEDAVRLMENSGIVDASEHCMILAAELSNQFKRFARLSNFCGKNEVSKWHGVISTFETVPTIAEFPRAALGPHEVLKPAMRLLINGNVRFAYRYERLLLSIQKLLASTRGTDKGITGGDER